MLKAFKYAICPTKDQAVLINKHIGSARFVYNLALEVKKKAYTEKGINLSSFDLIKQLPGLKEECPWLNEINAQSLQQPIFNLEHAFTRFFKRQGKFPKFKKKSSSGSFNIPQRIDLKNSKLFIPKFREGIEVILHRPIKGVIKQATISKTPTGKYFVSILCETGEPDKKPSPVEEQSTLGIDLGINKFIVTSDGTEYENPKYLKKSLAQLKFIQRKFSKHKGKRTKHRLALQHEKIANQRKDFLNKVSSELIRENQSLAIETLNIKNMLCNHSIAQSITDSGWRMFVDMLEYKARWYGVNILKIGMFEPSSKTCSNCGSLNQNLALDVREWTCQSCSTHHDRDLNAATNVRNFAIKNHLSVERRLKNHGELSTLVEVLTHGALDR